MAQETAGTNHGLTEEVERLFAARSMLGAINYAADLSPVGARIIKNAITHLENRFYNYVTGRTKVPVKGGRVSDPVARTTALNTARAGMKV